MDPNGGSNMKNTKLYKFVLLALFVALELVFRLIGLGRVPIGPLNMFFMTVPIAVGAMLLGPVEGMILGAVFGLCSLWDAISGSGGMTNIFFSISPVHTVILCVVTRALMGLLTSLIFGGVQKIDKTRTIAYFVGAFSAPFLNTLLFMGYIVLFFYQTEFVQNMVTKLGASGPIMLIVLMVGVQGLVEAATGLVIGGAVTKAVAHALKMDK
jgi:uncharacterized membrane protein